jgi:hypothetical protein
LVFGLKILIGAKHRALIILFAKTKTLTLSYVFLALCPKMSLKHIASSFLGLLALRLMNRV